MIKNHLEERMANDGEDGNGLRYRFLKKCHNISFSKVQVWLENNCCKFAKCCRSVNIIHQLELIKFLQRETILT